MKTLKQRQGRGWYGWMVGIGLLIPIGAGAVKFNYAAQQQNITIRTLGTAVYYSTYDPTRGAFVEASEASASLRGLTSKDGIVLWNDGVTYYFRFYDPTLRRWVPQNVVSGSSMDLTVDSGVVTWSSATLVSQLVYDISRHSWRLHQVGVSGPVLGLQTAGGAVGWSMGPIVFSRAYNPATGRWAEDNVASAVVGGSIIVKDGIVAWHDGLNVYLRTYDPVLGRWVAARTGLDGPPTVLRIDNGVAAWTTARRVYFAASDPVRGAWRGGQRDSGSVLDLAIRHGTVTWTETDLSPLIRGYNVDSGLWISGLTVPFAAFGSSATSQHLSTNVYFFDRSLGAAGWGWDFDDDQFRFEQATFHTFSAQDEFDVTLIVHGPHQSLSSASLTLDLNASGGGGAGGGAVAAPSGSGSEYQLLEPTRNEDGLLQVTLVGKAGTDVELEASADLRTWSLLARVTLNSDRVDYVDRSSANLSKRFYRARVR